MAASNFARPLRREAEISQAQVLEARLQHVRLAAPQAHRRFGLHRHPSSSGKVQQLVTDLIGVLIDEGALCLTRALCGQSDDTCVDGEQEDV